MANNTTKITDAYECSAVEILTPKNTGNVIGYCLGGGRSGPNLLVSGFDPLIENLFNRLTEIPTLPWMWGQLYLVNLNALDVEYEGDPLRSLDEVLFEDMIFLPPLDAALDVVGSMTESYRMVLRACAGMGMIAGRGISPNS